MNDDWLLASFESNRPRLQALAYRMLGSRIEAQDAVQEAWLRLGRNNPDEIENIDGLLTTVVGRVCLDRLRVRQARPEHLGDEVALGAVDDSATDPEEEALLAESLGAALMIVLDQLGPAERVAFVLHDVFAVPFDDIATIVGRSTDAVRKLASRARRRVQSDAPSSPIDLMRQREVVAAFLTAARGGDFDALMEILHPDVVLMPDAAASGMGSLRQMAGARDVANAFTGGALGATLAVIAGVTGFVWAPDGRIRGVVTFALRDDRIVEISVTGNPARIALLDIVTL